MDKKLYWVDLPRQDDSYGIIEHALTKHEDVHVCVHLEVIKYRQHGH